MKRNAGIILLLLFSLNCISMLSAQNPKTILDKASAVYNSGKTVMINFELISKTNLDNYQSEGVVYIRGSKFKIQSPDFTTWFDGKTQWSYLTQSGEVNVTNPQPEDLQTVSPLAIFNMYRKGFSISFEGDKQFADKSVFCVKLIPQNKTNISKVLLFIDKTSFMVVEVSMLDSSGTLTTVNVKRSKILSAISNQFFQFSKKEFPDAQIVDLR